MNIKALIEEKAVNGELLNDDLVQIIELAGSYLNLQTISNYAKASGLSYNGVKKTKEIRVIFDTRFVIDNE